MALTFYDLKKTFNSLVDGYNTPESFKIGEQFENYAIKYHFPEDYYQVLERTHDYVGNKNYVASSLNPDFKFRDRKTKKEFYVEAKFRTSFIKDNKQEWCKPFQLKRYSDVNIKIPVFLLLGLDGCPDMPDLISLMPLPKYSALYPSVIKKYEIQLDAYVTSGHLWSLK